MFFDKHNLVILIHFERENGTGIEDTSGIHMVNLSARYQSVALDKKDQDHKVTITVGGQEEDKNKSTHEASL